MSRIAAFDLHVHSHASRDACESPLALVRQARDRGLDGIALTDHDTRAGYEECLEHGLARSDGQPVDGFLVIPGIEITTRDGHLLAYGPCPAGLTGHTALRACRRILEAGGVPVPAHPFDAWRHGIQPPVLDRLPVTVIETFNAASTHLTNQRAVEYAQRRGLGSLGGSDAHLASAVGAVRTLLDLEQFSTDGVLAALGRGGRVEGRRIGLAELFRKQFALFFRRKIE